MKLEKRPCLTGPTAAISVVAMSIGLAACQWGMDVTVSGPSSAPEFGFNRATPFGRKPVVGNVAVYDADNRPIWVIDWTTTNCNPLPSVVYGRVPQGFRELRPALPLEDGGTYDIHARGCGVVGGARFRVAHGLVHQIENTSTPRVTPDD